MLVKISKRQNLCFLTVYSDCLIMAQLSWVITPGARNELCVSPRSCFISLNLTQWDYSLLVQRELQQNAFISACAYKHAPYLIKYRTGSQAEMWSNDWNQFVTHFWVLIRLWILQFTVTLDGSMTFTKVLLLCLALIRHIPECSTCCCSICALQYAWPLLN